MGYEPIFTPKGVEKFRGGRPLGPGDRRDGHVYVYRGADQVVLAVNVALATGRPLLVRGPSGSGKSSLAANVAQVQDYRYYEEVVTARTVAEDLLWHFDVVRRLGDAQTGEVDPDPSSYVEPGVLWWAFEPETARGQGLDAENEPATSPGGVRTGARPVDYGPEADDKRAVVLIDEIDKADPDVPNSLLVPLGSFEFTVRDTRPPRVVRARAGAPPLVVITTNDERELPPAFLRRCLALELQGPDVNQLVAIAQAHFGRTGVRRYRRIAEQIVELGGQAGDGRGSKASTAEFIDAVRASLELKVEPDPGDDVWAGILAATLEKPRDAVSG
jgi:MoxR-like ATPase